LYESPDFSGFSRARKLAQIGASGDFILVLTVCAAEG
jgi:hypothetical protein